ncbi:MAG: RidA family protein [Paludibacteraceae bacterium]|nr:RidA family protein [Paludibacteraceae bacterium]MBR2261383.1 RidA family protein [Paludibacteraceae bacterium]MEE3484296.1 RidA family protein [Bacteroidales bacterium]
MKTVISTPDAPKAIGPYSQAIVVNGVLYASGQIAIDPNTGTLSGNIESQTRQVMQNIGAILKAANMSFSNVVKTTVFITNMSDFATVNSIYAEYFVTDAPARSCVAVDSLPKGALIEIEIIAAS